MRTAKMAFDIKISDNIAKLTLSGDIDLQVSGDIKSEIERLRDVDRLEIVASEVFGDADSVEKANTRIKQAISAISSENGQNWISAIF